MKNKVLNISFIFFSFLLLVFFYLLVIERNPSEVPSTLINRKVPVFEARTLFDKNVFFSSDEIKGEKILVNFFATWCGPCREEHKYLNLLSKTNNLKIIGINYKDDSENAINWISELGNPYSKIIVDPDGLIGIEWGVYGIPETYIINSEGIIKYRLVGPITKKNYKSFNFKIINSENQ